MSDAADIAKQLALISHQLRNLQTDVDALRRTSESNREEYRRETGQLRGDLALMTSRQNVAIEDNKKKSHALQPLYKS